MPTAVPVVAAHSLSEWREPAGRTGDGYLVVSLTIPASSAVLFGLTATVGVQTAQPFQFRIVPSPNYEFLYRENSAHFAICIFDPLSVSLRRRLLESQAGDRLLHGRPLLP